MELKEKLGPVVGVPVSTMSLVVVPKGSNPETCAGFPLSDENAYLGAFPVEDFVTIKVIDTNPYKVKNEFSDLSRVQKYEMPQEQYEKRTGLSLLFLA